MTNRHTVTFAFQYIVDLGHNNIGQISINHTSDPFVQASKFCAHHQLPAHVITILGEEILQEMHKERAQKMKTDSQGYQQGKNRRDSKQKTQTTQPKTIHTQQTQEPFSPYQTCLRTIDTQGNQIFTVTANQANIFERLYNNHKTIEVKKELKRKQSYQSIHFKPQINSLSRQIVNQKRLLGHSIDKTRIKSFDKKQNQAVVQREERQRPSQTAKRAISRQKSRDSLYERGQQYIKRSIEKREQIKHIIENKLMNNCTFRPKIIASRFR